MRARVLAALVALAMLAPAAAVAAGPLCAGEMPVKGHCCCSPGDNGEDRPAAPTVETTCCCELDEAPAERVTSDALAPQPRSEQAAAPARVAISGQLDLPRAHAETIPVRARGPPPTRSLLSQHTSLVC